MLSPITPPPTTVYEAPAKGALPDADFLRLGEEEAGKLAETRKMKFRIIERDGKTVPVTREINDRRVNFIIRRGKIFRTIRG